MLSNHFCYGCKLFQVLYVVCCWCSMCLVVVVYKQSHEEFVGVG
jgi:hypothetical protein